MTVYVISSIPEVLVKEAFAYDKFQLVEDIFITNYRGIISHVESNLKKIITGKKATDTCISIGHGIGTYTKDTSMEFFDILYISVYKNKNKKDIFGPTLKIPVDIAVISNKDKKSIYTMYEDPYKEFHNSSTNNIIRLLYSLII
jgi:hypothetical protein